MAEAVLVTGGTGYVAGWCIAELLNRGYAVRTTVRNLAKEAAVRASVAPVADAGDRLSFFAADLVQDAGWDAAVNGCDYVWHVASPLGATWAKDPNALIVPARDGALRVLRASLKAGVKRVVMTSSTAASSPPLASADSFTDETLWTDAKGKGLSAYRQSKTIAERAAWDFMAGQGASGVLTTVLSTGVLGPVLTADNLGSVQVVGRMLSGRLPGTPRIGFTVVDVRDLVHAHLRAMTTPAAAGQRFIAGGDFMWMADIAKVLRRELGEQAKKVPTRQLPSFLVRLAAVFDPALRELAPGLGHKHAFSSEKAKRVLDWAARPTVMTIVDCAKSLIEKGAV